MTLNRQRDFYICAARCSNGGIGLNNSLPWPHLSGDHKYYTELTSRTTDPNRKVARIAGRLTWLSSCQQGTQSATAHNVIISSTDKWTENEPCIHKICKSFDDALTYVSLPPLSDLVETVWVMGGEEVYKVAVKHPKCKRIYLTEIHAEFDSDRFFPEIGDEYQLRSFSEVDGQIQTENGIQYKYTIYERVI